jgi:hypothetical protein
MAEVKISADSGGGSVGLVGPASTTGNAAVQLKLPIADGSAGQVLKTDGSGNLSWVDNFPTHYDTWQLGANKNWSGTNYLDGDFDRSSLMPQIGSGMTRSGTDMTFPTTGLWEIHFIINSSDSTENAYTQCWISRTVNGGSNWTSISSSLNPIPDDGSETVYASAICIALVDVTSTSDVKVKFGTANQQGANVRGSTSEFQTGVIFKRIGDT